MNRSREIFSPSGEPINDSAGKEYRKGDIETEPFIFDRESRDARVEAILEKIDFNYLETLFRKRLVASGIDPEGSNFISPSNILACQENPNFGENGALGYYSVRKNLIGLSYDNIEKKFTAEDVELAMLHTIIHEEVHASSKNILVASDEQTDISPEDFPIRIHQTGYGEQVIEKDDELGKETFERYRYAAFEEGVTEKLAREIFEEYLAGQNVASEEQVKKYKNRREVVHSEMGHESYVRLVEKIIEKISRATGISSENVWKAIVRGKFQGDNLEDEELKKLFAETFSEDFLRKLEISDMRSLGRDLELDKKQ